MLLFKVLLVFVPEIVSFYKSANPTNKRFTFQMCDTAYGAKEKRALIYDISTKKIEVCFCKTI